MYDSVLLHKPHFLSVLLCECKRVGWWTCTLQKKEDTTHVTEGDSVYTRVHRHTLFPRQVHLLAGNLRN